MHVYTSNNCYLCLLYYTSFFEFRLCTLLCYIALCAVYKSGDPQLTIVQTNLRCCLELNMYTSVFVAEGPLNTNKTIIVKLSHAWVETATNIHAKTPGSLNCYEFFFTFLPCSLSQFVLQRIRKVISLRAYYRYVLCIKSRFLLR